MKTINITIKTKVSETCQENNQSCRYLQYNPHPIAHYKYQYKCDLFQKYLKKLVPCKQCTKAKGI